MSPKLLQPILVLLAVLLRACTSSSFDFDGDGSPDDEDCAPEDAAIHPGANDPYGDGIDQDCGGTDGFDGDGDGFPAQEDCNDNDATIHPGADEIEGNGIDEDCDGFDLGGGDDDDDDTTTAGDDDDTTAANIEGDEPGECDDGADNDADTLYDCDDPDCAGAPACEAELNTPPTALVVEIVPANPHSTHALNCLVETPSEDVDGHLVTYTWAWTVNSTDAGISGVTVPAEETSTGDTWTCTVTPNDGFDDGPAGTASVTVTNLPPSAPGVGIFPSQPVSADDLTCVIEVPSVDPEGMAVSYTFLWDLDGSPVATSTATIAAADTLGGQVWTCTVTPNDGGDDGPLGVASATVNIPLGCWDGSVEEGAASWGRADIVFCSSTTGFIEQQADALVNCGFGWRVCTGADFMSRNDLLSSGTWFWATVDDGADCGVTHSSAGGSTQMDGSLDTIIGSSAGSCSGPTVGGADPFGRRARTDLGSCIEPQPGGQRCGVLCCYD